MRARTVAALAAALALTGCATPGTRAAWRETLADERAEATERADYREARARYREALADYCAAVPGACDADGVPVRPLPAYTDHCGFLPPVYGDDC